MAAAAYIAVDILPLGDDGDGSVQNVLDGDNGFVQRGLRTANRDHFAVCVDTYQVDEGLAEDALRRVAQALDEATEHPDWTASVGTLPPTVELGCPESPAAFEPGVHTTRTGRILSVDVINAEASEYKAFLYVVPETLIDDTFGDAPPLATQERLRINLDQALIVSFAIFVTPSQAFDIQYLRQSLLVGAEAESEMIFYDIRATATATPNE